MFEIHISEEELDAIDEIKKEYEERKRRWDAMSDEERNKHFQESERRRKEYEEQEALDNAILVINFLEEVGLHEEAQEMRDALQGK
jgi:hypothetical protein